MKKLLIVAIMLALGGCSFLPWNRGHDGFDVKAGQAYVPDGQSGDKSFGDAGHGRGLGGPGVK